MMIIAIKLFIALYDRWLVYNDENLERALWSTIGRNTDLTKFHIQTSRETLKNKSLRYFICLISFSLICWSTIPGGDAPRPEFELNNHSLSGSIITNLVPRASNVTATVPLCATTIDFTIASPMPLPSPFRWREGSTR